MKTPFQRAQESYEASWVNGPPENPVDSYIESLSEKTLSELEDEKASLLYQEPECDEDCPRPTRHLRAAHASWKSACEALEYEIEEREKAVRAAFENLPLHQLLSFSTSCPMEQEILDEVKAEFLEAADEDE
jgi:hypothetical protein